MAYESNPDNQSTIPPEDKPTPSAHSTRLATSVGSAIAWSQSLSLIRLALSFIFSVVVVRSLEPNEYGLYAFLLSVVATAGVIVSLGFDGVIGRYASKFHALSDSPRFSELLRELLTWRFVLTSVAAMLLWAGSDVIAALLNNPQSAPYLQWIGMLLVVQNVRLLLNTVQYAILNTRFAELIAITERVVALGCSIIFFSTLGKSLSSVLLALIIAESVAFILSIVPLLSVFQEYRMSVRILNEPPVRSLALHYWGTDLVTYALSSQLAILLISLLLSSNTEIAYYSIGMSLITQISAVAVSSWKNLPLPALSQARSKIGEQGVSSGWALFLKLFAVSLVPIMMFLFASATALIRLLYGADYAPSAGVVQIYAFFFIAAIPSGTWGTIGALYVMEAEGRLFRLRIITATANILLILFLVPVLGFWGAAISTSLASTLSNWAEYILLRRRLSVHIPWRFFASIVSICIVSALVSLLIPDNNWLMLSLRFVVYGFCAVVLSLLLKPFEPQEISQVAQLNAPMGKILQYAGRK